MGWPIPSLSKLGFFYLFGFLTLAYSLFHQNCTDWFCDEPNRFLHQGWRQVVVTWTVTELSTVSEGLLMPKLRLGD